MENKEESNLQEERSRTEDIWWLVSCLMQQEGTSDTFVESNLHLAQHYLIASSTSADIMMKERNGE
jgi:hypothetical protein